MFSREFQKFALAVAAVGVISVSATAAVADDYPNKPIHLLIGSAPGGGTDTLGRVLAKTLETQLGASVVVQNQTGAAGGVMLTRLINDKPDGYTIGMVISQAITGNPNLNPGAVKYTKDDFTYLASVSKGQCALVTYTSDKYKSFPDMIAAAKKGDQPAYASQSGMTRLVADYIEKEAGIKFRIITVQGGGGVMQAILGKHVDFGFSGGPHVQHVAAGTMRVLASTEDNRLASSPKVPTLKEMGFNISSCSFFMLAAPKGMTAERQATVAKALKNAINSDAMKKLLINLKLPPFYNGPAEVKRLIDEDDATVKRVVARVKG